MFSEDGRYRQEQICTRQQYHCSQKEARGKGGLGEPQWHPKADRQHPAPAPLVDLRPSSAVQTAIPIS